MSRTLARREVDGRGFGDCCFGDAGADVIVTGDGDLLTLGPVASIAIVTPARFLTTRPE